MTALEVGVIADPEINNPLYVLVPASVPVFFHSSVAGRPEMGGNRSFVSRKERPACLWSLLVALDRLLLPTIGRMTKFSPVVSHFLP